MADAKSDKGAKGAKGVRGSKSAAPKSDASKAPVAEKKVKGRQAPTESALAGEVPAAPKDYVARLQQMYREVIAPSLMKEFGYTNPMQAPRLEKIVLNMGVGEAVNDTKKVTSAAADLALIAGQRPVVTRARKAISTFKVRENMPIGAKVTLRKTRMYEFLDRLVTIALPRIRDFRGLNPKSFDGRGNYAMGIKEHIVFPEIDYDKAESILGMDIIVCTTAKTDNEARALLRAFNFPFRQ